MKKKVVPKLQQKVKVNIATSDDIKIYYTGEFQDFTVRYNYNKLLSATAFIWPSLHFYQEVKSSTALLSSIMFSDKCKILLSGNQIKNDLDIMLII